MKAAVLFKPNEPLQVLDCELDPPKAGEVRVRMKASGVCQSDWHIMNGDWPSPMPIVPGHEAAGEIAECGPGVTTVKPGDHVIFSFRPHCGRCSDSWPISPIADGSEMGLVPVKFREG